MGKLREEINKALNGPCETLWCDDCKLPVDKDHKHQLSIKPIDERPEGDCYVVLYNQIQAALDETKEPREPVQWFSEQMERKLAKHDDRPGWQNENFEYLLIRLMGELGELCSLPKTLDHKMGLENVIEEAADVGNFAMMVADNARRLLKDN